MSATITRQRIAGHMFADTPNGEVCIECGRKWIEVLDRREEWKPGVTGIAQSGALTTDEIAQLHAKLDRIWNAGKI